MKNTNSNRAGRPGSQWVKVYTPFFPFKLEGKWYIWKKVKVTYLISSSGKSIPIAVELAKETDKGTNER